MILLKLTVNEAAAIGGALTMVLQHFAPDDPDIISALAQLESVMLVDDLALNFTDKGDN